MSDLPEITDSILETYNEIVEPDPPRTWKVYCSECGWESDETGTWKEPAEEHIRETGHAVQPIGVIKRIGVPVYIGTKETVAEAGIDERRVAREGDDG